MKISLVAVTIMVLAVLVTTACSGDKTEPLQVVKPTEVKPAEFKLGSLVVTPSEVILGDQVKATVEVSNIGDLSGNYTCALLIDGVAVEEKEVTLDARATKTVILTFTPKERGAHKVAVGNLSQTINVKKSADFVLSSTSPDMVVLGSRATVTAIVANTGDIKGDTEVVLRFNGKIESQDVSLAGGENKTVSFTVAASDIGVYGIEVKAGFRSVSGTLAVVPPAPVGYKGYADHENGFFIIYADGSTYAMGTPGLVRFLGPTEEAYSFYVAKYTSKLPTAREILNNFMTEFSQLTQHFTAGSIEDLTINGIPAARGTYTLLITSSGVVKYQQVVLIKDSNIHFTISFRTRQELYDKFVKTFNTIANSFTFLPIYP